MRKYRKGSREARVRQDDDEREHEEEQAEEEEEGEASEQNELAEILSELGAAASEARIIVYKLQPNTDPEECVDCALSLFSKEQLRADYGSGVYRVEVRQQGRIRRRWFWRFAAPLTRAAAPSTAPSEERARELERALASQRESEQRRQHEITLALLNRPQQTGPSLSDLLGILTQAKDVLGLGGNGGGIKDIVSSVKDVLALRDSIGGSDRETNAADVFREGLQLLPDLLATAKAHEPLTSQRGGSSETPVAKSTSALDRIVTQIRAHAIAHTPAAAVARLVWSRMQGLADDPFDALASALDSPGFVPLLVLFEPRLASAQPWLESVATELRPLLSVGNDDSGLTNHTEAGEATAQPIPDS